LMADGRLPLARLVGRTRSRDRIVIRVANLEALLDHAKPVRT
jgi:hypothetical protein